MAIGVFIGCGKKHTLLDIQSYYNNMVEKYSYDVTGEANVQKRSYIFGQRSSDGKVPGTSMVISYNGKLGKGLEDITNSYNSEGWEDVELYNRYFALVNIEQKILDWTYNYYTSWADNLYGSYDLIKHDVKKDDVEKLYNKVKNLDSKIAEFVVEKTKAEDEINAITFEGAINLTSFTYAFNDLIEASFDFVNTFKNFHVKYIWDTYTFGENEDTNKLLLDRLIDETYLNIAQMIYYENVKAYEYRECDLNTIVKHAIETEKREYVNVALLYSGDNNPSKDINKSMYIGGNLYSSANVKLTVGQTYNEKLENFIYYLKAYNQKINIYKDVYAKLDFYKYNQIRLGDGTVNLNEYKSSLSRINRANLSLVEDFSTITFINYVNSFAGIF